MILKQSKSKRNTFLTHSPEASGCFDESETPFLSSIILCFYVLKIIRPNGL